jgi:hypothetical protein
MKTFLIYICCECPNNICSKINSFFNLIKQGQNQEKKYIQVSSNIRNLEDNNDINNPAKILSSEEINEMIKDQIKYNKEQANSNNGYKIIKQKNPDDGIKTGELINVEEIKKEMNQIEFEEEEQKLNNKNEINNNDDNGKDNNEEILDNNEEEDVNLNIEELRKDVLENNDDLD